MINIHLKINFSLYLEKKMLNWLKKILFLLTLNGVFELYIKVDCVQSTDEIFLTTGFTDEYSSTFTENSENPEFTSSTKPLLGILKY